MRTHTFSDFTGGFTDKPLQETNRYAVADNVLIDNEKIQSRNGFNIFSSTAYRLGGTERVAKLINFDFDSELFGVQNKKLFYISAGAWTEKTGPSGNSLFPSNTAASLIEEAQWNHHLYLTSDSGNLPAKAYRDGSNNLQIRTAGLPVPSVANLYTTDAAKLSAAITLAVDIKTQLHAHVNDYGVSPAAHLSKDTTTDTALDALTTPTTLAELIAYVKVLRTNYDLHIDDTRLDTTAQNYHAEVSNITGTNGTVYIRNPILNIKTDSSLPADANLDTIEEVVRLLNNLRNVYNWHIVAPYTHNNATQTSTGWGAHAVTTPELFLDAQSPIRTANITTLTRYVNYLKSEYNTHAAQTSNNFYHLNADSNNLVKMADATDLHTAFGLLGCLYFHYALHIETSTAATAPSTTYRGFIDADDESYFTFVGTLTSGSPTITSVTPDPTAVVVPNGSVTLPNGYKIIKRTTDTTSPYSSWSPGDSGLFPAGTSVSGAASGPNTITMSANASVSGTYTFVFSWAAVHTDVERSTTARLNSFTAANLFLETLTPLELDVSAACTLATTIAAKLKAHMISGQTALTESDLNGGGLYNGYLLALGEIKKNYTYYAGVSNSGSNQFFPPHASSTNSVATDKYWPYSTALSGEVDGGQGYFEAGLTVKSYLYKFAYSYDYTVGTVNFTDISAPTEPLQIDSVESPASLTSGDTTWRDPIALSSLPVLANTSNTNYDTSNIVLEIYRTIGDGSVYYKVDEKTNGTTTYADYIDDETLLDNEALYTNGGVVGNDAPPASKLVHVLEDRAYYVVKNKLYQSLKSDPDSVPTNFLDTYEEDIVAISSTRSNLVVFSNQNVYRSEGEFDELGNGFMRHERIFDKTGIVGQQALVRAENGVFFAGKDGFYYTDGFQCFRVTDFHDLFATYTNSATQRNSITGTYDLLLKKIYWTIKSTSLLTQPDLLIVMDLQYGIKKDITPCTTFSGGFDSYTGFNPTTLIYYNNAVHYGDQDGYVFFLDPNTNMDLRKDTSVAATSWEKRTVLYRWKSCDEVYGGANFRKYFTRVNAEFEQSTNLSVQIISDSDKGRIISYLPIIRSRKLLDWGDPKIDWTSSVYTAKDGGVIDEFRRFRADGSLRSNYRAIEVRNAYCVVVASNIMGGINVANISANLWSATLINTPTYKWPLYSVGYYLRINGVDYPVTVRTSDSVIRISDAGLTPLSSASNISWELWGYPKNERMRLVNIDVNFEFMGQTQKDYQGNTSTDGGQNPST